MFQRITPYAILNDKNPLLSYALPFVRGVKTPTALLWFSRYALIIMSLVVLTPLCLFYLVYSPTSVSDTWHLEVSLYYGVGAMAVSIFLFPIVDFFTIFFAIVTIRGDQDRAVKFDLLRLSTVNPMDYLMARMALAKLRVWRVFVFMWAGRVCALVFLVGVLLWAMFYFAWQENFQLSDFADVALWYGVLLFLLGGVIFVMQLLLEPLWRLDMLIVYAASVAARFAGGAVMWFVAVGGAVMLTILQGVLAVGVVYSGVGLWSLTEDILYDANFSWSFTDRMATLAAFIPYMVMPFLVWWFQRLFKAWRGRVAARYVFKPMHGDR